MFALSHSVAAQTATLASVRLFASRLYFVLLLLPIVVKVFISMRARDFFSDDAKKSLFHFYSRDTPSAKRASVSLSLSLSLSRPLSISRGWGCVCSERSRARTR
jgi:hypothetical protein